MSNFIHGHTWKNDHKFIRGIRLWVCSKCDFHTPAYTPAHTWIYDPESDFKRSASLVKGFVESYDITCDKYLIQNVLES